MQAGHLLHVYGVVVKGVCSRSEKADVVTEYLKSESRNQLARKKTLPEAVSKPPIGRHNSGSCKGSVQRLHPFLFSLPSVTAVLPGYPGVPVTDMATAQLEALKALKAPVRGVSEDMCTMRSWSRGTKKEDTMTLCTKLRRQFGIS